MGIHIDVALTDEQIDNFIAAFTNQAPAVASEAPIPAAPATTEEAKPAKKKRKRRTKAEIAADEAKAAAEALGLEEAEQAAEEPEAEPVEEPKQTAEITIDEEAIKAAVVAAVKRLGDNGVESPTKVVVGKLTEVTGKQKVSEVETSDYPKLLAAIKGLGA